MIDLSELALRRYELREPAGPVRFEGARVIVWHVQELFSAMGEHYGTGVVTVEGRRLFGGKVLFDPASEPAVSGASLPADQDYLRRFARDLLEVLKTLCVCGGLPGACACCPACAGSGQQAGEHRSGDCDACAGSGLALAAEGNVSPRR